MINKDDFKKELMEKLKGFNVEVFEDIPYSKKPTKGDKLFSKIMVLKNILDSGVAISKGQENGIEFIPTIDNDIDRGIIRNLLINLIKEFAKS